MNAPDLSANRPRPRMRRALARGHACVILLGLGLLCAAWAQAAPPTQQWFTVLLDGRKTGTFETTRQEDAGKVVSTQTLDLVLERAGSRVALHTSESTTESLAGAPLAFSSTSRLSGTESRIDGRVAGGRVAIVTRSGAQSRPQEMAWPAGALLTEGLRLQALQAGLDAGTHYASLAFQPSGLQVSHITSRVGAAEQVDLPAGTRTLVPIDQDIRLGGTTIHARAWVDAQLTVHKMTLPILGTERPLLACDHAGARAPNQPADLLARTLVRAPRPLRPSELAGDLRYTIVSRDAAGAGPLPQTGEQAVQANGQGWRVDVSRHARPGREPPPRAADSQPNDWLQSNAPELRELARRAYGDARDPTARMQRMETFVRGYIVDKSLDVGYASALEVARHPEGDCTEHALLLAALGRAAGIPTRVAYGLAWAPGFAGHQRVFVPHAWTQAWVGDRWRSYDAALDGFDAGHITLAVGDGDPWRFYAGIDLLGRLTISRIEVAGLPEPDSQSE